MIESRSADVLQSRAPVVVEGDTYFRSDWMDTGRDPAFSPTTFLVEQQPFVSLRTHFHRNDQFQLFLHGRGAIGRHPVDAVLIHFATGYSAYGPIVAGADGLTWLTLRTVFETGSLTMKDHADAMRRVPKRQHHSPRIAVLSADAMAALASPAIVDVLPRQADGFAAQVATLPAGAALLPVDPSGSAGQFRVVLAGSMIGAERELRAWEHGFVAPGEGGVPIVAGDAGAQVVVLQFPAKRVPEDRRG